jgi:hypothetical protein
MAAMRGAQVIEGKRYVLRAGTRVGTDTRRKPDANPTGKTWKRGGLADHDLIGAHVTQHIAGLLIEKVDVQKPI